jgi:hypothetical protein
VIWGFEITNLVELVFTFFGIVHGGIVAVVCEVPRCDETIATFERVID